MNIPKIIKRPLIAFIEWIYRTKARYISEKQYAYVSNHFIDSEAQEMPVVRLKNVLSAQELINLFVYKDESWSYIKNLEIYLKQMKKGNLLVYDDNTCKGDEKYIVRDDTIVVDSAPKNDNWLCFFLNEQKLSEYVLSFDIEISSDFTEIQVAFCYKDLGNRYRFMIRDNREAVFECVYQGEFFHSIRQIPFILHHGKKNKITVAVLNNHYQFFVDGTCIFSIRENTPLVEGKDIALILWNKDGTRPIKCEISNISLAETEEH